MSAGPMGLVLKNPGMDWYSPLGCEYRSTIVCRAVLSTSEYQLVPPTHSPRKHRDALVLTAVPGNARRVLGDWYSEWYSEGRCSVPLSVPAARLVDHPLRSLGEGERSAAARICRRAAALYERRAREALSWSRFVRRSVLGLALLVVPFVAVQRWPLVRDASSHPVSAQVSGPAIALCHKPAHNAAEIGAKSARRGRCSSADHLGGGHCA